MEKYFIKKTVERHGTPLQDGQYSTNLGYVEIFSGMWMDVDEEPQWWMEEVDNLIDPEAAFLGGYKKRLEQMGIEYDFAADLAARSYYIKYKSSLTEK